VHGPQEVCALLTTVRLKRRAHFRQHGFIDLVVGKAGVHHALREVLEAGEMGRLREAPFGDGFPAPACRQGAVQRSLGGGAHQALVVVQAHQLVHGAAIDRFGHV
jgi:hypothetical protein